MIAFFLYLIGESRYPLTSPFVFRDLEKKDVCSAYPTQLWILLLL